ncbi:RDD family protein [Jeotgalibacillus salarius]|uniref:RDD family protein n=1 Tax=Jeotgalibacillus salarius TaxID=546023 RepID=A0A4Y8LHN5_9BACL|nr:RDD family protein [Jeotgalibacillus salarius]TFE02312.1 RDD family protein [Jeotgalibacillus salarius]
MNSSYGGFWRRFVAFMIDGLIIVPPFMIISYLVYGTTDFESIRAIYLPFGLISTCFFILFPITRLQATPGKAMLGMKITNRHYEKISFWQSFGRYFASVLSHIILFIGYFMIGFTPKKRGLHDFLAHTVVIKKTSRSS